MDLDQPLFYASLVLRSLQNELSENEELLLQKWLSEDESHERFMQELRDDLKLKGHLEFFSSINSESAWNKVSASLLRPEPVASGWRDLWKYAAVIVVVLSLALYYFDNGKNPRVSVVTTRHETKYTTSLKPGGDKATLRLADGSVIVLEDTGNGVINHVSGMRIIKQNGRIIYQVPAAAASEKIAYNTITTPRGGQYQVMLPDGSNVWLNASTSLRFPTSFAKNERLVTLSGEAYFEISKDAARPFLVAANDTKVQVYGTHFNLAAYANEAVRTTLLEGSVKVSRGGDSKMIVPGEQATIPVSGAGILVKEVDPSESIDWKEGMFIFNNEEIEDIMHRVSRWYDADIRYEGAIPDRHFTGKISRYENISKILELLELTGGISFKTEGKKIIVSK